MQLDAPVDAKGWLALLNPAGWRDTKYFLLAKL